MYTDKKNALTAGISVLIRAIRGKPGSSLSETIFRLDSALQARQPRR